MPSSPTSRPDPLPRAAALLPLLVFLALYLGSGLYFQWQGVEYAFYQVPAPVAILPAILLAVLLSREPVTTTVEQFLEGVGNPVIVAMVMIFLLAGAFGTVAQAIGGVESVVNLSLTLVPQWLLLPGLFLVGAFISTAMGTSMGTIAALAPIAKGLAEAAGLPLSLTLGTVVGGAMFGDNLSIISDTTIAATRTQGCRMTDKFRVNLWIATPAALATVILLLLAQGETAPVPEGQWQFIKILPYLVILLLAVGGVNVFVVLTLGLLLAGGIGLFGVGDYTLLSLVGNIEEGFGEMQEILLLSLLIGGLGELMRRQGGLAYLLKRIETALHRLAHRLSDSRAAALGIAVLVGLVNLCTANNTVAILISGEAARALAVRHGLAPRYSASLLDIFACACQGLLPYGAQILLAASLGGLSPLQVAVACWYPALLGLVGLGTVFLYRHRTGMSIGSPV